MQQETLMQCFVKAINFVFYSLSQKDEHAAFCVLPVQEPTVDNHIDKNLEKAWYYV